MPRCWRFIIELKQVNTVIRSYYVEWYVCIYIFFVMNRNWVRMWIYEGKDTLPNYPPTPYLFPSFSTGKVPNFLDFIHFPVLPVVFLSSEIYWLNSRKFRFSVLSYRCFTHHTYIHNTVAVKAFKRNPLYLSSSLPPSLLDPVLRAATGMDGKRRHRNE